MTVFEYSVCVCVGAITNTTILFLLSIYIVYILYNSNIDVLDIVHTHTPLWKTVITTP